MKNKHFRYFTLLISAIICFSFMRPFEFAYADQASNEGEFFQLTREEQQYIVNNPVMHVTYLDGSAPIVYTENGDMQGIMRSMLDEIEERTGFVFEYIAVSNRSELMKKVEAGQTDIVGAIPEQYLDQLKKFPRSKPFLRSETVLFMRTGVDVANLSDYLLGIIDGAKIPENINKSKVKFYKNREQVLNAVVGGKADYCYANVFSIAYYTARNGYNNVISIPQPVEPREYFLIFVNSDPRLISIFEKAMGSISNEEMSSIILESTSQVEQKLSFKALIQKHIWQVVFAVLAIIIGLALILFIIDRSRRRYKNRNEQYLLLADMSDEYMYEYDFKKDRLSLSAEVSDLLGIPRGIENFVKSDILKENKELGDLIDTGKSGEEVVINLNTGERGFFKLVNSLVCNGEDEPCYITGKLVDIREEKQRIHELKQRAQKDGLTGLYNSKTTRELIERARYASDTTNAMFIIDIDRFKTVNDTYGHPVGDIVLIQIAEDIKEVFRDEDIVGRIGGDEFCIFIDTDITVEILVEKCEHLQQVIAMNISGHYITPTISIGVVLNQGNRADFDEMYKVADKALYKAKLGGRNNYVIDIIE